MGGKLFKQTTYDGWWTNRPTFARFSCEDSLSGCKDENRFSSVSPLVYGATSVNVTFWDNVDNKGTLSCSLGANFKPFKYDPVKPDVFASMKPSAGEGKSSPDTGVDIIGGTSSGNVVNEFSGIFSVTLNASDDDKNLTNSVGISGVKKIRFESILKKDDFGVEIANGYKACSREKEYWENQFETTKQETTETVTCDYKKAWTYSFKIIVTDHAGNEVIKEKNIRIVPNNNVTAAINSSIVRDKDNNDISSRGVYANNSDYYQYAIALKDSYGNPIHKKVYRITTPKDIVLKSDNASSGNAIYMHTRRLGRSLVNPYTYNNPHTGVLNEHGFLQSFKLTSYAPGKFSEKFDIKIPTWDKTYNNTTTTPTKSVAFSGNSEKIFLPLYKADMRFANGESEVIFGQEQSLEFLIERTPNIVSQPENVKTNAFYNVKTNDGKQWIMKYTSEPLQDISTNPQVLSRNFIGVLTSTIKEKPDIFATPRIYYTLNGKEVEYNIGKDYTVPVGPLSLNGGEVNSIYIAGQEQSANSGKKVVTNTVAMGRTSWNTVRDLIVREVANLTRNRSANDGKNISGVKYVSGDRTLSGDPDFTTLIVEDGNVTFDNNFNTQKKNIAIILINKTDSSKGNIYIKPNVAFISALIFADGSIESIDDSGNIFGQSNSERGRTLNKQIVFHGGLFTRNTVGGAVMNDSGKFTLPGGETTTDIHQAVRYDLSFLRMRSWGKDDASHTKNYNQGRSESVVIFPNNEALQDPPPGFKIQ